MHALAAVRREIGARDSSAGYKYLREFTQAFQKYESVIESEALNERLARADILLVGDYHALPASQRFTAELIEKQAHQRPVVLGLEAVLSRGQRILDEWWRRAIGEEELRRRLRFDREWGYDWIPFYALLVSAREHAEGIYGLDCMPREDLRRIRSRDRHAALKICEIRERHPNAAIVVLFGESHMAPEHLPALVSKYLPEQQVLTVLQNVDALYWPAIEQRADAVSVANNTVCVFNSSPLEKYESYRLCLEKWNAAADDHPDFAPAVYNVILALARTLGFRSDSPRNGSQPRFLADSLPEVICVHEDNPLVLSWAERVRFENQGCVYSAEANCFFVREFQMPRVAEEATRFLYAACQGWTNQAASTQQIEDALAQFGSKLLCPGAASEDTCEVGPGQRLYASYVEARITKAGLRRIFLTHTDDSEQRETLLEQFATACLSVNTARR
jgi:hypothetical protein